MWFYICNENNKKGIVDSSKAEDAFLYPRQLETGYGEKGPEKKICIAPTIGQCMVAKPDDHGRFYIYRFDLKNPIHPSGDSGIHDISWSDEHWITDEVIIEFNNGFIKIECIGHTDLSPEVKNTLKRLLSTEQFPKGDPKAEERLYGELAITIYNNGII